MPEPTTPASATTIESVLQEQRLFPPPAELAAQAAIGQPMDLDFTGFEVIALGLGVLIVNLVSIDARSNWLEGVLLLATYAILATAFFYYPA